MAKDWLDELNNTSLKDVVTTSFSDDQFTYSETLDFLEKAAVGGFSSSELEDLRLVYQQNAFENDYVSYITLQRNYTIVSCEYITGGVELLSRLMFRHLEMRLKQPVSAECCNSTLIGKWFLGTDLPMPISGGDTANPDASSGVYDYGKITGELFTWWYKCFRRKSGVCRNLLPDS